MSNLEQQITKFEEQTGIKLIVKDKKPYYGGGLYLRSTGITSLPDNLTVGGGLYLEGCIECYRVITGACAAGTRDYVENRLPKPHKEKYTIREIIDLTDGEYGSNALKEFFTK